MAMTQIPRDFLELLKLLNQHGVKYLVIGGYAVIFHGHNRMTGDLDLFTPPNMLVGAIMTELAINGERLTKVEYKK